MRENESYFGRIVAVRYFYINTNFEDLVFEKSYADGMVLQFVVVLLDICLKMFENNGHSFLAKQIIKLRTV